MAQRLSLKATKREVFGKKLHPLRKQGMIPGNIYGKNVEPLAVFFDDKELKTLLKDTNETTLVDLLVGSDKARPVILRKVTKNVTKSIIINHVDIQQVNLKEKMQIEIPVKLIGENELATKGDALLETITSAIEVEALPTNLPEDYEIDITGLTEIGQHIYVKDLPKIEGVEVLTDGESIIVTLTAPQSQVEPEEEPGVTEKELVEGVPTTEEGAKTEEAAE
jgi:large subunit ribosomal protein L25